MSTEKNPMPIQEKYLLTSHEASIYFNIGIKNMRCLARDRSLKISVKIRGRTLIVRSKFEEYVLSLLADNPTEDLSVSPLCEVNDFDCT
jgi:hypothetical protein